MKGIGVQAHCDDLAVVVTADNIFTIYDVLKEYKAFTGTALLNTTKSYLISKSAPPNSLFPSFKCPR